jgi:hypothetical protein
MGRQTITIRRIVRMSSPPVQVVRLPAAKNYTRASIFLNKATPGGRVAGSILWMAGLDVFAPRDANQLLRPSKRNKTSVPHPFLEKLRFIA